MSRGIEWEGVSNLVKAIEEFEDSFIDAIKGVIARTATEILVQAQALAPVDDGNLRKSIELSFSKGGLKAEVIVGAEYGIYLEFGTGIYAVGGDGRKTPWVYWSDKLNRYVYTRGIKAQPYWTPAFEQGMRYFVKEMNKLGA